MTYIPPTRITLGADRVRKDITEALAYADAIDGATGTVVLRNGADGQMEADEIRATARQLGIEHIQSSLDLKIVVPRLDTSMFAYLAAGAL